jgi:hypothetical protein
MNLKKYPSHSAPRLGHLKSLFDWRLAPCIKQRLGFVDVETVEQIRESPQILFFIDPFCYFNKVPLVPSMMVNIRKRFSVEDLSRINELIAGT